MFWERYNLPYLEEAFQRGDNIRLLSDPDAANVGGFYKRELEAINIGWTKSDNTFITPLLRKYNYQYNPLKNTYEKIR